MLLSLLATIVFTTSAAAQEPEPGDEPFAPDPDAVPGLQVDVNETVVYLDQQLNVIDPYRVLEEVPEVHAFDPYEIIDPAASVLNHACTPVSGRDDPHRSSTGQAASGHGWWGRGTCTKYKARVLNCLYEYYTDGSYRQKACSAVETLSPGTGGSSQRTDARINCPSIFWTTWRNHVNVDVIDQADTNEVPFNQRDIYCRVP